MTLDVAIKDGITGPLGMNETSFAPTANQRANMTAHPHVKGEDGTWADIGEVFPAEPEYWAGGHGLHSTPRDFIRFQRALLGGGELDGVRILEQATVDAAFTNQIGDLDFPAEIPHRGPGRVRDLRGRSRPQVGLRAADQHRGPPGHAPRRVRSVGGL